MVLDFCFGIKNFKSMPRISRTKCFKSKNRWKIKSISNSFESRSKFELNKIYLGPNRTHHPLFCRFKLIRKFLCKQFKIIRNLCPRQQHHHNRDHFISDRREILQSNRRNNVDNCEICNVLNNQTATPHRLLYWKFYSTIFFASLLIIHFNWSLWFAYRNPLDHLHQNFLPANNPFFVTLTILIEAGVLLILAMKMKRLLQKIFEQINSRNSFESKNSIDDSTTSTLSLQSITLVSNYFDVESSLISKLGSKTNRSPSKLIIPSFKVTRSSRSSSLSFSSISSISEMIDRESKTDQNRIDRIGSKQIKKYSFQSETVLDAKSSKPSSIVSLPDSDSHYDKELKYLGIYYCNQPYSIKSSSPSSNESLVTESSKFYQD